jgi:hypothetical protein
VACDPLTSRAQDKDRDCYGTEWRSTATLFSGPDSVVGIATGYGLDGPGIESRWGVRFAAPVQTGPGVHPASCTMGTRSFPGVKSGRGVTLTPYPPSSTVDHERVELYLYSSYGPYGLYKASVPVQGCTLPLLTVFSVFLCSEYYISDNTQLYLSIPVFLT